MRCTGYCRAECLVGGGEERGQDGLVVDGEVDAGVLARVFEPQGLDR